MSLASCLSRVLVGATLIDQKLIPEAPTYSFGPDGTEKIGRKLVQYFLVGPEYDVPRQSIN